VRSTVVFVRAAPVDITADFSRAKTVFLAFCLVYIKKPYAPKPRFSCGG
jgi:hypothetical protein